MLWILLGVALVGVVYGVSKYEFRCPTGECTEEYFCQDCNDFYSGGF